VDRRAAVRRLTHRGDPDRPTPSTREGQVATTWLPQCVKPVSKMINTRTRQVLRPNKSRGSGGGGCGI
jgi:hypothetical protein